MTWLHRKQYLIFTSSWFVIYKIQWSTLWTCTLAEI